MAGNWFYVAIFLKIFAALHPGRECPCYIRKILGFHEWLLEALYLALLSERERNAGKKKCLQNNPNRASERNAEKLLTKISLTEPQLREPLNSECHAQCTLSFCYANFRCFELQQSGLGDAFSASMLFLVGGSEVA